MEITSSTRRLCTFHLDRYFVGVDVTDVQEVIRYQNLTPVPLSHSAIQGLINLRGQIVTTIDLRERLALSPRPEGQRPMNIVIQHNGELVSLLVDEIGEVLDVEEAAFEPMPESAVDLARGLVLGAYKLSDRLLLHLNMCFSLEIQCLFNV